MNNNIKYELNEYRLLLIKTLTPIGFVTLNNDLNHVIMENNDHWRVILKISDIRDWQYPDLLIESPSNHNYYVSQIFFSITGSTSNNIRDLITFIFDKRSEIFLEKNSYSDYCDSAQNVVLHKGKLVPDT